MTQQKFRWYFVLAFVLGAAAAGNLSADEWTNQEIRLRQGFHGSGVNTQAAQPVPAAQNSPGASIPATTGQNAVSQSVPRASNMETPVLTPTPKLCGSLISIIGGAAGGGLGAITGFAIPLGLAAGAGWIVGGLFIGLAGGALLGALVGYGIGAALCRN